MFDQLKPPLTDNSVSWQHSEPSQSCFQSCIVGKRVEVSQKTGSLPSIRAYILYRHLVAGWCNCYGWTWCHWTWLSLTFQQRAQMLKLNNGFSRYSRYVALTFCCHFCWSCTCKNKGLAPNIHIIEVSFISFVFEHNITLKVDCRLVVVIICSCYFDFKSAITFNQRGCPWWRTLKMLCCYYLLAIYIHAFSK